MKHKAVIHTGFPSTLKHEAAARVKGRHMKKSGWGGERIGLLRFKCGLRRERKGEIV